MTNKKLLKTAVFIDASNLELSAKSKGWRVDYKKLLLWLEGQYNLVYLGFFTARFDTKEHDGFLTFLKKTGYSLVTKPLKHLLDKDHHHLRKANFDVEIAVESIKRSENYKTFVLFSGDSDFDYLIKELNSQGKHTIVISMKYHISRELIENADQYIDLSKIKKEIVRN